MKLSLIWIDRENAKIFHFSDGSMERKRLHNGHQDHHTHRRDKLDLSHEEPSLFFEASAELAVSDRVVIIGPGMAKHHFQSFLAEQRPLLFKKVVGIETVDHPTDGKIASLAKHYFEKATA